MGAAKIMECTLQENEVKFEHLDEDEIVKKAQSGNVLAEDYLVKKYKRFAKTKARSYFLVGADNEDVIQEGMIGLFKAIRDYKPSRNASFSVFANMCIQRQIITAIKTATRQKHQPLNYYISLNKPVYDEESERTLLDMLKGDKILDPEILLISKEQVKIIDSVINDVLSGLELEVLKNYLSGDSYKEISKKIGKSVKSIDNALQRVKKKLEKVL